MPLGESFADFQTQLRAQNFDEFLDRAWAPGTQVESHSHAFAAKVFVAQGEMWLTVGAATRHLPAGSTFELEPHVTHAERYGDDGTTVWIARRHKPA